MFQPLPIIRQHLDPPDLSGVFLALAIQSPSLLALNRPTHEVVSLARLSSDCRAYACYSLTLAGWRLVVLGVSLVKDNPLFLSVGGLPVHFDPLAWVIR